ncbi:flagellar protein FlaG [Brevibacillus sp. SYSU BS000544]|uniref:flagellar protein FlaG n=1 Tax=Brevibacillus sp. SYSU BS000544 TaxID=3416443 RepID=UPI003CE531C1
MDLKSVGNVSRITTSYEKNLSPDTAKSVQTATSTSNQVAPIESKVDRKDLDRKELEKEMEGLNKWLQSGTTHLKFQLHEKLNEYYVAVVDDQTNQVIREIPSKKMMDMVAKMHEMIGILIDEKR